MRIFFSTLFDQETYPLNVFSKNGIAVGDLHAGPLGLIGLLELHLGLANHQPPHALRLLKYRDALKANLKSAFYEQSFSANDLEVSQTLLLWRDELKMAGWDFKVKEGMPKRLMDLAKTETCFDQPHNGFADRFNNVLYKIKEGITLPVQEITHLEPYSLLPEPWRRMFDALKKSNIEIIEYSFNGKIDTNTDLGILQQYVHSGTKEKIKRIPKADGTLQILRFPDVLSAADGIAAILAEDQGFRPVVVNETSDPSLSFALSKFGLPTSGQSIQMTVDPRIHLLQSLKVWLWKPNEAQGILEFFLSPINIFPPKLCQKLASVFSVSPGFGSKEWQSVIDDYLDSSQPDIRVKTEGKVSERLAYLIASGRKKNEKFKVDELFKFYNYIYKILTRRLHFLKDDPSLTVLSALCATYGEFLQILESLPFDLEMNELDIDKIVDLVLASVSLPNLERQKGGLTELNSSSLLVGGVKELLWFNFYGSASRAVIWDHWTRSELDWLKQEGLLYDEASQCAKRQFYFLRNWIKYVTDKVIFVIPSFVDGETPQPHPFMPYMESLFDNLQSITFNYQVPSDVRLLKGEKLKIVEKRLDLIPSFPVYWKIGNDNILLNEPRESGESHNSLIKLLKYPYQWVLEYKAKLKRYNLISMDSMHLYRGILSHSLYEEMLTSSGILTMPKTEIDQLYARQLEKIISEYGLRLFEFGQESYLAAFKNKLLFNFHILLQHIVSGGWSIIGCELTEKKEIQGICINGKCDLLLQRKYNGVNQTCVMDLKYSGANKYRGLMEKGEDLQLAIYSKLFQASSEDSPTAYFIIEQGSLFTRDLTAFPKGVLINGLSNNSVLYTQLINKLVKTIQYRRNEILNGNIEVGEDVLYENLNIFTDCDEDTYILPEVKKMKKIRSEYNEFTTFIDTE